MISIANLHFLVAIVCVEIEFGLAITFWPDYRLDNNLVCGDYTETAHEIKRYPEKYPDNVAFIVCPISSNSLLPSLVADYKKYGSTKQIAKVMLMCNINDTKIMLDKSIFQLGFTSPSYDMRLYAPAKSGCELIVPPDLFDNVNTSNPIDFHYDLRGGSQNITMPQLVVVDSPCSLQIETANAVLLSPIDSLVGSKVTSLTVWSQDSGWLNVPSFFVHDAPSLTRIKFDGPGGGRSYSLDSKAFSQLKDVVHCWIAFPLRRIASGAFDSINHIQSMRLKVNNDAMQGPLFSNVTKVDYLRIRVEYVTGPECPEKSIMCPVLVDVPDTQIGHLLLKVAPWGAWRYNLKLGHNPSFQPGKISADVFELSFNHWPYHDRAGPTVWAGDIFENLTIVVGTFILDYNKGNIVSMLSINFTTWSVNAISIPGHIQSICDSSWLTLPDMTTYLQLQGQTSFPLVLRDPRIQSLNVSVGGIGVVDCSCSISWMKQLVDCGKVSVDPAFLERYCSALPLTVAQFLNSTTCCSSTDPPTMNNEPNMPLDCSTFLAIPPELLYFNNADLPQCRGDSWQFDPCDVIAFYTAFTNSTTTSSVETSGSMRSALAVRWPALMTLLLMAT